MLTDRDRNMLVGVKPDVLRLANRMAILRPNSFRVLEGLRSKERQAALVKSGASQTQNSRHLVGEAVDFLPLGDSDRDGKTGFDDWDEFYPLAECAREAAKIERIALVWGGNWSVELSSTTKPAKQLVSDYVGARRAIGKRAFIDGPHFQLGRPS